MGDGDAVQAETSTVLRWVGQDEVRRALAATADPTLRAKLLAEIGRLNTLAMIKEAGSGHPGTSLSSMDILAWLFLHELRLEGDGSPSTARDIFFSSKGHDAPALYSILIALGHWPDDELHRLRRLGGPPGHPHVGHPYIYANTGSLGMGVSKAKGMLRANRLLGRSGRVFVLMGDGELQEGQVWESLAGAARDGLKDLWVVIDHNKIQSDTWVADVADLGDVPSKLRAFGWHVERCDGNDVEALSAAFERARAVPGPKAILADTIKGKGVSFMEGIPKGEWRYRFHSGAPQEGPYAEAVSEVMDRLTKLCVRADIAPPAARQTPQPAHRAVDGLQRLLPAYTDALLAAAANDKRIVALDADLVLDTGLIPFRERFPDRFVECGIAEQDMVSQAGGLALRGLVPVAHSFAAFLSARPNEQIYNNASEGTKVVYVGSLAGLLPGGPGHSHQCVRDIASVGSIPGLVAAEPSCPEEVGPLFRSLLDDVPGSGYLRLGSVAWEIPFPRSSGAPPVGEGRTLRRGRDAVVIGYGMVALAEAWRAADLLASDGIALTVINLPWLNRVNGAWLVRAVAGHRAIVTLDNHYVDGGQGDRILAALAESPAHGLPALRLGVRELPVCGKNEEVLRHHRLDAESLRQDIRDFLLRHP